MKNMRGLNGWTLAIGHALIALVQASHSNGSQPAQSVSGEFWTGPGIGGLLSLSIKEDRSFCFRIGSDIGVLEEGCGQVTTKDGRVSFRMPEAQPNSMTREDWFAISWGERLYLIPQSALLEFANSINEASEPRSQEAGTFSFRRGDSARLATGVPLLPDDWNSFVLGEPVRGLVTRIDGPDEGEIGLGLEHGLKPGMRLWVKSPKDEYYMVEVDTSQRRSSWIRIALAGDGPLFVGQAVTSRPDGTQ